MIKKAVIPAAGLGTRFLPATKAQPKEMLPIIDTPTIQYVVQEAVDSGIEDILIISGKGKRAIEDHFDKNYELEAELEKRHKKELLDIVQGILPAGVSCVYIRQAEALGLGHAVLCAEAAVGNEPFAVILPDDLIDNEGDNCMQQMVAVYNKYSASVIGTQTVNMSESDKYGMVAGPKVEERLSMVDEIIEKPAPAEAPSDQAVVGRYILTPAIFDILKSTERGAGGEIQLTDGIAALRKMEAIYAYSFEGTRYDCGSKIGYLQATVEFALKHEELSGEFDSYLKNLNI